MGESPGGLLDEISSSLGSLGWMKVTALKGSSDFKVLPSNNPNTPLGWRF